SPLHHPLTFSVLFFHCSGAPRYLHSFPTRRSSDLRDVRRDRREQLRHGVRRAGQARMRVRAAAATWREREHRDEPLRALRRGVDRRESAGTLADQEPALLIEVALCPRPRDRRQEIQRRAFTRTTEI